MSCDLCGLGAGDAREIPFLTVLAPEVGDVRTTMCGGGPIEGSSLQCDWNVVWSEEISTI